MAARVRIRVIAHRGRHDRQRENSLGAFRDAISTGADAAELDVRLTRDGVPVLAHDPLLWGRVPPRVVRWSSARRLGCLTRLDELLTEPVAAGHELPIVLDVKRGDDLGAVAAYCLERADAARIALWCRDADQLGKLPRKAEFGELSLLPEGYERAQILGYLDDAAACGSSAVSLHPEVISASLVVAAHQRGLRAYAWIRSPADHVPAVRHGVDGLVTDWIDEACAAVRDAD